MDDLDNAPYEVKKLVNDNKDRSLQRNFTVTLTKKEAEALQTAELSRPSGYFGGNPALLRTRSGTFKASIFKMFGVLMGTKVAKAKLEFTDPHTLRVSVRSGGIAFGWFMLLLGASVTLFILSPYVFPEMREVMVNDSPFLIVFPLVVFGGIAWLFLARVMRVPHINDLELYLRDKVGGTWHRN